jgi:hypothetical protein
VPSDAERAAEFLIERVRAARGRLWDEGAATSAAEPSSPALRVLATRRVRGVPPAVARRAARLGSRRARRGSAGADPGGARGARSAGARAALCLAGGGCRRAAHGDPRHPDGLSFVLHDLCHLEKFAAPEHHRGQVGFFRATQAALDHHAFAAIERELDGEWRTDRDYVISDMNGSAVFLFAVLKMKVNMAVRRRLARARGERPATEGPLDARERAALEPVLGTLFEAMALPADVRPSAFAVSARRSYPAEARLLLAHFEARGVPAP